MMDVEDKTEPLDFQFTQAYEMQRPLPVDGQAEPWYKVIIKKINNGFIIKIGCATFVSQDWNEIASALKLYWEDPVKAQEKYYKP